jgi:hypothetical protein
LLRAPISAVGVSKAIKRLKPSKCAGADGILFLIIKGRSHIFIPLLTFIFNLSVTTEAFPFLWKHAAAVVVVSVFKESSSTVVYYLWIQQVTQYVFPPKVLEFIIHDHLSYFFKCKFNPS